MRINPSFFVPFIIIIFALVFQGGQAADLLPDPVWKVMVEEKVAWQKFTPDDKLIVETEKDLMCLEKETGRLLWTIKNLSDIHDDYFNFIPGKPYAIAEQLIIVEKRDERTSALTRHGHCILHLVDYGKGSVIWTSRDLGLFSCQGSFLLQPLNAIMIYGRDEQDNDMMQVVDLATGNVLWRNENFFAEEKPESFSMIVTNGTEKIINGNQLPLFDSETTFITYMSKKYVYKWNAETGESIWKSEIYPYKPPVLIEGYMSMTLSPDRQIVFVPCRDYLFALRTSDGSWLWDKPVKLRGIPRQVNFIDKGMVVWGESDNEGKNGKPYIILLDPQTGQPLWKEPFKKLKDGLTTNFILEGDRLKVYSDKKIYDVNVEDGSFVEFAKDLKFDGKETPAYMKPTTEGYYLLSSQNLMLVDKQGQMVFHTFSKAPGVSSLLKLATIVGSIAGYTLGYYMVAGALPTYAPVNYRFPRFKASVITDNYMYMLTEIKPTLEEMGKKEQYGHNQTFSKPAIVKVNNRTGEIIGRLFLQDKTPIYDIDNSESKLFYAKDKEISCYEF
jgi:outer membrane protein assembly factor BamB